MVHDLRPDVPPDRPEPQFTDAEARKVLARAAERERALGTGVSAVQLRDAALEAGISAAAFDGAVAEVRAAPAHRRRRRSALLATVVGLALLVGTGIAVLQRDVAPRGAATPASRTTPSPAGDPGARAAGPGVDDPSAATACAAPDGVPAERLRALAGGLYPEVLAPANRHRSLVVALLFDADCHLKAHVFTRRGATDGPDEVLQSVFPAAHRAGWQVAGGADAGPWTFEKGKPSIIWGVERESR